MKVQNLSRNAEITGATGALLRRQDLQVVKAKPGVTVGQLTEAMRGSRLDHVALEDAKGDLYVVFADQLRGKLKLGDTLQIEGLSGRVVAVDKGLAKGWVRAAKVAGIGLAAAVVGLLGGGFVAGGMSAGTDGFLGVANVLGGMILGAAGGAATGTAGGIYATRPPKLDPRAIEKLTEPVPEGALSLLQLRAGKD